MDLELVSEYGQVMGASVLLSMLIYSIQLLCKYGCASLPLIPFLNMAIGLTLLMESMATFDDEQKQ